MRISNARIPNHPTAQPEAVLELVATPRSPAAHGIVCPLCRGRFDLLSAPWCGCDRGHPSKICPSCDRCLCAHPDYDREALWREAPAALRTRGFEKLFIYYL